MTASPLWSSASRARGPFATTEAQHRFDLSADAATAALESLERRGRVIRGPFTRAAADVEWCDVDVLRRIRKLSLATARGGVEAVTARDYARFLMAWQDVGDANDGRAGDDRSETLLAAIEQIQGLSVPASALEADILASRVPDYRVQDLELLIARGDVVLEGRGALGSRDGKVALYFAPNRALLGHPPLDPLTDDGAVNVRLVLQAKGAVFFPEIERACPGVGRDALIDALWALFWNGEITNDSLSALRTRAFDPGKTLGRRFVAARTGRYRSRLDTPGDAVGRFSLLRPHLAPSMETQLAAVEQWLSRHGVLTREAISVEAKEGGFSAAYPILRALEERGQIRRGYFIEGLGALQFARPEAVDRMRKLRENHAGPRAAVLAATDPANPFGIALPWPAWCEGNGERRARAHVVIADGELTALMFGDGARVVVHLPESAPDRAALAPATAHAVAAWMRRRAVRIIGHAGQEMAETPLNASALAHALRDAGLTPTGPGFRI